MDISTEKSFYFSAFAVQFLPPPVNQWDVGSCRWIWWGKVEVESGSVLSKLLSGVWNQKGKERFDERVHEPLPWNYFDAAALLDFSKSFQSEWIKLTVNGVISWCCEAKKNTYISTLQQLFSQMKLTGKKCFWAWHCNYTRRPVFQIQKRQSWLTLIKHDRCRRDITVCRQVSMDWEEIEPRSQQLTLRWVL